MINWLKNTKLFKNALKKEIDVFLSLMYNQSLGSGLFNKNVTTEIALANWCFVCINKRAKALSGIKSFAILPKSEQGEFEYLSQDNWLSIIINRPNPLYAFGQLKFLLSMYLDLTGNAYLYFVPSGKEFIQAWILPSNKVKPTISRGQLYYEVQMPDSKIKYYLDQEICHIKTLVADNTWNSGSLMGSPYLLKAATKAIGADDEMIGFIQNYIANELIPPFIMSSEQSLSSTETESIKQAWNQTNKKYPVVGLLSGVKIEPLTTKSKDSANNLSDSLSAEIRERIAATFDIPPALLISDYSNRATAEIVQEYFYKNTIEPIHNYIDEEINLFLDNTGVKIWHEPFAYQSPEEKRLNREFYLKYGIVSINDIRKEEGLDVIPNGDQALIQNGLVPLDSLFLDAEVEPAKSYEIKKTFVWHKYDKITEKYYVRMTKELNKALDVLIDTIDVKSIKSEVVYDIDFWTKTFMTFIEGVSEEHIRVTLIEAFRDIELNPERFKSKIDKLIELGLDETALKIRQSTSTISEEIINLTKQIIENNTELTEAELTALLEKRVKDYADKKVRNRLKTIARTTTTTQKGIAQQKAWTGNGYRVVWLSERDAKVRKTHKTADGSKPDSKGYFHVGSDKMKHPGGGNNAEENSNCRCSLFPEKIKE